MIKKIMHQYVLLLSAFAFFFCQSTETTNQIKPVTVTVPTDAAAHSLKKQTTSPEVTPVEKKGEKRHGGRCRAKKKDHKKEKKAAKKTIKDMSYEELKELKGRLVAQKKTDAVIKCLEKMVAQCKDITELKACMLELADILFDTGMQAFSSVISLHWATIFSKHLMTASVFF